MRSHNDLWKRRVYRVLNATMLAAAICGLAGVALGDSPLARLRVVGIRKEAKTEYPKRVSNDVKSRHIVRFRLEVSGDQGIYVLAAGPKGSPPLGYCLERNAGSVVWLEEPRGEEQLNSPGAEKLTRKSGAAWIWLPASSAYEWEIEATPSPAGIDESRSLFTRKDMRHPPTELISPWYRVDDKTVPEHAAQVVK